MIRKIKIFVAHRKKKFTYILFVPLRTTLPSKSPTIFRSVCVCMRVRVSV